MNSATLDERREGGKKEKGKRMDMRDVERLDRTIVFTGYERIYVNRG